MLHSNRVSKPKPNGALDEISLNHLGGIRAFIERCAIIEAISDEMRHLVETRWPDLMGKLPPKH
jgi:hypothetical protein